MNNGVDNNNTALRLEEAVSVYYRLGFESQEVFADELLKILGYNSLQRKTTLQISRHSDIVGWMKDALLYGVSIDQIESLLNKAKE